MKVLSPNEVIVACGGFGKYQKFIVLLTGMITAQIGLIVYTLDILLLDPKILCDGQPCDLKDICIDNQIDPKINWAIDWQSPFSLKNWMYDLNMFCAESYRVAMFGSLFFLGYTGTGVLMQFM